MPFLSMLFLHRPRLYETLVEGKRLVQEMRCLCALRCLECTIVVVEQKGTVVRMCTVVDDLERTLARALSAQIRDAQLRDDDIDVLASGIYVRALR